MDTIGKQVQDYGNNDIAFTPYRFSDDGELIPVADNFWHVSHDVRFAL
jgi:hypothetical protein